MADKSVYNKVTTYVGGRRKMDGSCIVLEINNNSSELLVVQQAQLSATRQPTIVWEIGSNNYYKLDARPSGSAVLANVIGPTRSAIGCMIELGDICKDNEIKLNFKQCQECTVNPPDPGKPTFGYVKLTGGMLTSVTLVAKASDVTVAGQWQLMFADMVHDDKTINYCVGGSSSE